jgi:microcystin-dependent protein
MSDQYLGMIFIFGGNFNPFQFQLCNGQLLPISQNTALFSLIGTYYGGNGTSNFQLPDLRGRASIGMGQGLGTSDYVMGEQVGTETTTMLSSNIPLHNHLVNAYNGYSATGATASPATALFAEAQKAGSQPTSKAPFYYETGSVPNTPLAPTTIGTNLGGGSIPFNILQPYLALSYIIAMSGIFPARN